MLNKKIIKKIEEEARKYFKGASGCHDWSHVERVRSLAIRIARKEKADVPMVEAAALLHDIGRKEEMRKKGAVCHAEKGARAARVILGRLGIEKETIDNISHSILAHRYHNSHLVATAEARSLFDADKLDSLGAIGVGRIFLFAGNAGSNTLYTGREKKIARMKKDFSYSKEDSPVLEFEKKLRFIKDKMMTREGRKIARLRHGFMKDFFERMWEEVRGQK